MGLRNIFHFALRRSGDNSPQGKETAGNYGFCDRLHCGNSQTPAAGLRPQSRRSHPWGIELAGVRCRGGFVDRCVATSDTAWSVLETKQPSSAEDKLLR